MAIFARNGKDGSSQRSGEGDYIFMKKRAR